MSDTPTRIRSLLNKKEGKTQAALARFCNVSTSAVSQWLNGGGISLSNLQQIALFFNVSPKWLETGDGDPDVKGLKTFVPNEETPPEGFIAIKEYKLVFSAGPGAELTEPEWVIDRDAEEYWYRLTFFTRRGLNPERCKRACVKGDSMEPYIMAGDHVMWYEEIDPRPGCVNVIDGTIYCMAIDGLFKLKRLSKCKNGIVVMSDNQAYQTETYIGEECDRLRIYGRVIEITRT